MICQGCGGVVGRDCYNPSECLEISNRMNYDTQDLERQIEILKSALSENNIPIPNLAPVQYSMPDGEYPF